MKKGDLEGTPEEIRDFLYRDEDFDISAYVQPDVPLRNRWLIIPALSYVVCLGFLNLHTDLLQNVRNFIFSLGCFFVLWISFSIHIRFKILWSYIGFILFCAVLVLLLALGDITVSELLTLYKETKK